MEIKLLQKQCPELNLKLSYNKKKEILSFSGNQTPSHLQGEGLIDIIIYGKWKVLISSINSPELRVFPFEKHMQLFIGGNSINTPKFCRKKTFKLKELKGLFLIKNPNINTL